MATRKSGSGQRGGTKTGAAKTGGAKTGATKAATAKATSAKSGAASGKARASGAARSKTRAASATKKGGPAKPAAQEPVIIDATAIDVTPAEKPATTQADEKPAESSAKPETPKPQPEPVVELKEPRSGENSSPQDKPKEDKPTAPNDASGEKPASDPATGGGDTRRAGFGLGALALTALIGGALGWGAVTYLPKFDPSTVTDAPVVTGNTALETRLDEVTSRLDDLAAKSGSAGDVDLGPLQTRMDALGADITALRQEASDTAADLRARVEALETQAAKAGDGGTAGPSDQAIAALDDLRAEIDAEIAHNKQLGDQLAAALDDAQAKADAAAQESADLARQATAQIALSRIAQALESGESFAGPLDELRPLVGTIPQAMQNAAADGVTPLSDLQARFDDLSRDALLAVNRTQQSDDTGFWAFLRSQVSTRSTQPTEGDSADAVLSRAGGAVRAGDLQTALDLIATLPDPAQEILAGWTSEAHDRVAVAEALAELKTTLNP